MKKLLLCFILLLCLIVTGCAEASFDLDQSIKSLQDKDFETVKNLTAAEELQEATEVLNSEVKFAEGTFTVECTRYTHFQKGDHKNACAFIEFATAEQAQSYYDLYLQSRTEESLWKLALHGKVVVLSNSEEAMELIVGEFK